MVAAPGSSAESGGPKAPPTGAGLDTACTCAHGSEPRLRRRNPRRGYRRPKPIAARHANPEDLGVLEAASLLQAGLLSSGELTQACQERIAQRNGPVTFDGLG